MKGDFILQRHRHRSAFFNSLTLENLVRSGCPVPWHCYRCVGQVHQLQVSLERSFHAVMVRSSGEAFLVSISIFLFQSHSVTSRSHRGAWKCIRRLDRRMGKPHIFHQREPLRLPGCARALNQLRGPHERTLQRTPLCLLQQAGLQ